MAKINQRVLHAAVIVAALVPVTWLAVDSAMGRLGANPIETLLHRTGWWGLTFLMLTLAVTPLRQLTGIGWLVKLRRTLGLYAFFYATLHFSVYIGIDQFFAWEYIVEDIAERPYITLGFAALLIMLPLALTSTKTMVKRLGGKRWSRLHKLIYGSAVLGVIHFFWLVKADLREPAIFAAILTLMLGYRISRSFARGRRRESQRSDRDRSSRRPTLHPIQR
jgi:sulfoxide reductase heme-binding subunit YedZ